MIEHKNRRGLKMYFISDHEYILFPLQVHTQTYLYYTLKNSKKQYFYSILSKMG